MEYYGLRDIDARGEPDVLDYNIKLMIQLGMYPGINLYVLFSV